MLYGEADADRRLTIEEFERLPEEDGHLLELVRGRIVREARPNLEHGRIVVEVNAMIRRFVSGISGEKLGSVHAVSGFALPGHAATVRGPTSRS